MAWSDIAKRISGPDALNRYRNFKVASETTGKKVTSRSGSQQRYRFCRIDVSSLVSCRLESWERGSTTSVDGAVDGEDVRRHALYIPNEAFSWCSLEYRILSRVKGAKCFICLEKIRIGIAISLLRGERKREKEKREREREREETGDWLNMQFSQFLTGFYCANPQIRYSLMSNCYSS